MKKIAFTFAGREKRMSNLVELMGCALNKGIIDEWHVWDLTRQESDRDWLMGEFGKDLAIITDSTSIEYNTLFAEPRAQQDFWVRARNDAHVLLMFESGICFEIVLGAYENTKSILRIFNSINDYKLHASPIGMRNVVLNPWDLNHVTCCRQYDSVKIFLNREELFRIPVSPAFGGINRIAVHTGYGAEGFWQIGAPQSKFRLMQCFKKGYDAFKFIYKFYAASRYASDIFAKIDDDIVYFDVSIFSRLLQYVEESPRSDIYSANVINNGICAHLQSAKGYFPGLKLQFEYPAGGFGGSLWESGHKCTMLHEYFLENSTDIKIKALSGNDVTNLPYKDRFSINFIGFRQQIFPYMVAAYASDTQAFDDEILMTQVLPVLFDVKKFVVNSFIASHLSFYKQEVDFDAAEIVDRYRELVRSSG